MHVLAYMRPTCVEGGTWGSIVENGEIADYDGKTVFLFKKESNMEEKQIENVQNQNNKPETNKIVLPPKKGDPGYDAFMRRLFRSAASNMLRDDEI